MRVSKTGPGLWAYSEWGIQVFQYNSPSFCIHKNINYSLCIMPTLSMFFGIIIRMYYAPKEHNPPHIHVYYQDMAAVMNIEDGMLQMANCL